MKVAFRLLILLLVISCNKNSEEELNDRITEGKPFFDFDEVVHYEVAISEYEFYNLLETDTLSRETKLLADLLGDSCPKTKTEINNFKEAIHSKIVQEFKVNLKFTEELKTKIFSEKKCYETWQTACEPLYRDIFIFKKNNKEIGIAKICFKCGQYSFSDGNFIADCFKMNGELKRLKEIIAENKKSK